MHRSRPPLAAAMLLLAAALTSCASGPAAQSEDTGADDHGAVAGAEEVTEPPLALVIIDAEGAAGMLDLLTDEWTDLDPVAAPFAVASDGRYVFLTTEEGLAIVDSGRWSWDHVDHFHYYRGQPQTVGSVPGDGPATVVTGMLSTAGSTGVYFHESGEAVLLDNRALHSGEVSERFRIEIGGGSGLVAPVREGALITVGGELVHYDGSGRPTGAAISCVDAAGAITTRVGLIVGCADGAVVTTWVDGAPEFQAVPYPDGVDAERAESFASRKGRPTVAATAGDSGFWLLDSRELAWQYVATAVPLRTVVAVDDEDGHVVALDADGRIRVYEAGSGAELAVTEPIVAVAPGTSLTVDGQRAYLNDPVDGVVYEIAYADGARIARTLQAPVRAHVAVEVGR